jgi:ubiquinone/menaquinone biosynthesis C-methylase UbiE
MKVRESGMPDEATWASFFNPEVVLRRLGLRPAHRDILDFGCGYGTFAIPAAKIVSGVVYALDCEPEMVAATLAGAAKAGLANVRGIVRDFFAEGTGAGDSCMDYVTLCNILHAEHPEVLLQEAFRILKPGGHTGIIHWNYDPATPRGPSLEIRPRPEQCRHWAESVGFRVENGCIDLLPYHYGMVLKHP